MNEDAESVSAVIKSRLPVGVGSTSSEDKSDNKSETSTPSTNEKPKKPDRISQVTWERFQSLQSRAENLTRRSTEKRVKHLQKQILDTVKEKLNSEEERAILQEHKVELGSTQSKVADVIPEASDSSADSKPGPSESYQRQVQQYLGINDHLRDKGCSSKGPQSGLEKQVDDAVARGDVKRAEELSDCLATRDFAVKITEAVDAREYLKRKKEEEDLIKAKKKKKLNWGFEHKQRWETKGNM